MKELLKGYDDTKYESEYQYLLEEYGVHKANGAGYIAYRDEKEYITDEYYGQGYIYKDYDAWIYGGIVYVPEYGFPEEKSEWVTLEGLPGTWTLVDNVNAYTKEDFIDFAVGIHWLKDISHYAGLSDEQIAYDIFDTVDWQYPESYIDIDLYDLEKEDTELLEESKQATPELDKLLGWDKGYIVGISACVGTDCSKTAALEKLLKKEKFDYVGPSNSFWYDKHEDFIYEELGFLVNIIDYKKVKELGELGISFEGFNQNEVYVWKAPINKNELSTGTVKQLGYATELDGTNYRIDKEKFKTFENKEGVEPETALEENIKGLMKENTMTNKEWEQLIKDIKQLRKEITLNSLFLRDYENSLGYDVDSVYYFFDGYAEYLHELLMNEGKTWNDLDDVDTDENLEAYIYFFEADTFPLKKDKDLYEAKKKSLKEATGNFTLSDYGFPTFAYMAFDWALDYISYYLEEFGYDANAEYENDTADDEARYAAEEKGINYMQDRWKELPEEYQVDMAIEEANGDIYDLFNNTPLNSEAELELGNEWEDRFKEWSVYDEYSYELPEIKIKAGYYEGASIVIEIPYIEVINAYDLNDKIVDIMYKHFGKDGLKMASIGVAYRFSSGETAYNLVVENKHAVRAIERILPKEIIATIYVGDIKKAWESRLQGYEDESGAEGLWDLAFEETLSYLGSLGLSAESDEVWNAYMELAEKVYNLLVAKGEPKGLKESRYEYDLQSRYDARQSFYNKARVIVDGDKKLLISYNTIVAEIEDGKAKVYGTYSQTTLRHIKEFLLQHGFEANNKAQIMADYGATR